MSSKLQQNNGAQSYYSHDQDEDDNEDQSISPPPLTQNNNSNNSNSRSSPPPPVTPQQEELHYNNVKSEYPAEDEYLWIPTAQFVPFGPNHYIHSVNGLVVSKRTGKLVDPTERQFNFSIANERLVQEHRVDLAIYYNLHERCDNGKSNWVPLVTDSEDGFEVKKIRLCFGCFNFCFRSTNKSIMQEHHRQNPECSGKPWVKGEGIRLYINGINPCFFITGLKGINIAEIIAAAGSTSKKTHERDQEDEEVEDERREEVIPESPGTPVQTLHEQSGGYQSAWSNSTRQYHHQGKENEQQHEEDGYSEDEQVQVGNGIHSQEEHFEEEEEEEEDDDDDDEDDEDDEGEYDEDKEQQSNTYPPISTELIGKDQLFRTTDFERHGTIPDSALPTGYKYGQLVNLVQKICDDLLEKNSYELILPGRFIDIRDQLIHQRRVSTDLLELLIGDLWDSSDLVRERKHPFILMKDSDLVMSDKESSFSLKISVKQHVRYTKLWFVGMSSTTSVPSAMGPTFHRKDQLEAQELSFIDVCQIMVIYRSVFNAFISGMANGLELPGEREIGTLLELSLDYVQCDKQLAAEAMAVQLDRMLML